MRFQIWNEKLPPRIVDIQAKLDPEKHGAFARDYMKRRKSLLIAYPLCLLGWHYLYLGKLWHQLLFLVSSGGLLVWLLVDLFRLPGMVANKNDELARDLLASYGEGSQHMSKLADFLS
jgi:hypothetical protein